MLDIHLIEKMLILFNFIKKNENNLLNLKKNIYLFDKMNKMNKLRFFLRFFILFLMKLIIFHNKTQ